MKLTIDNIHIINKYGQYFNNTGGNDIIDLLERKDINFSNNSIVAILQCCCDSQLILIKTLIREGIIKDDNI